MSDNPKQPVSRELFEKWLPIFQDGIKAKKELSKKGDDIDRMEKSELRRRITEGEKAFSILYEKIMMVTDKIIQQELDKPRSFHVIIERDDLEAAAYEGIYAALIKLDINKMKKSNLNLIMQYVSTKVSREALRMEASVGMSPSKLRLYKKIAAVRSMLRTKLDREPTDEEVLDYFHSGQADFKSMNGKVDSNSKPYKANTTIKLKDIQEQGELDKGHPFHQPVTDEKEIDASISVENDDFTATVDANAAARKFWTEYMDYVGIDRKTQLILADELKLFEIRRTANPNPDGIADNDCKQLARDFLRLIQNRKGRIKEFSEKFTEKNGEGFWRVFIENLTADRSPKFIPSNTTLHMRLLHPNNI